MDSASRPVPIMGLVLIVGAILAAPILGMSIVGLVLDTWLGTGPILFIGSFVLGNLIAWTGVRLLYLRERRRFARS